MDESLEGGDDAADYCHMPHHHLCYQEIIYTEPCTKMISALLCCFHITVHQKAQNCNVTEVRQSEQKADY